MKNLRQEEEQKFHFKNDRKQSLKKFKIQQEISLNEEIYSDVENSILEA